MNFNPLQPIATTSEKQLHTLIENRTKVEMMNAQLNVFETHQLAEKVNLTFDDLVITAMLRGKKIMQLPGTNGFDYLPGETVIVQPGETMVIDFPEAEMSNPTQCIALAISSEKIKSTKQLLDEKIGIDEDSNAWNINKNYFHLQNSKELADSLNRIVSLGTYESRDKDVIADLWMQELIIRIMQTQARTMIDACCNELSSHNRFAYVVSYIKQNITERFDINVLCDKACMSRPSFFRKFKQYFGVTPIEYIVKEKMQFARKQLASPEFTVSEVCFMLGFANLNHFIQLFKEHHGITPKQFQLNAIKQKLHQF